MLTTLSFQPVQMSLSNYRTYLLALLFVTGNILLPQLSHLVPDGGKMFLPIYFFTLIAAYKFGLGMGLLTAVLSPLCNHLLFGMPPLAVLPILLIKSSLLAVAAAWLANYSRKISMFHLAGVVLAYQLNGTVAEYFITGNAALAFQDFRIGFPGMLIQVVGGWFVLKALAKYEC